MVSEPLRWTMAPLDPHSAISPSSKMRRLMIRTRLAGLVRPFTAAGFTAFKKFIFGVVYCNGKFDVAYYILCVSFKS